jgi:hypothetical protein
MRVQGNRLVPGVVKVRLWGDRGAVAGLAAALRGLGGIEVLEQSGQVADRAGAHVRVYLTVRLTEPGSHCGPQPIVRHLPVRRLRRRASGAVTRHDLEAVVTISYADIEPQDTHWLWPGRIPLGDVTLIFGEGAVGKGRMLASIIASVAKGEPVGTSTETAAPGGVGVIFAEDKAGEQVAKRLRAAGLTGQADLARVRDLTRMGSGSRFKLSATPSKPGHVGWLRAEIGRMADEGGNPRLVIIDPLAAVIGWGSIQTNAGARYATEPLQDLAEETGVAVIVIAHTTKAGVLQGSAGLMQALRVVYRVALDPVNAAERVITAEKANDLPPQDDLRFTIVPDGDGNARCVWLDRAAIDERRQGWRDRAAAQPGTTTPAVSPAQAKAAGCDHAHTRFGTDRQCPDCPAAGLRAAGPAARTAPARTVRPAPAVKFVPAPPAAPVVRPAATFRASVAEPGPGGVPATRDIPGRWLFLALAQDACQQLASGPLAWREYKPGVWTATGDGRSYAVATAPPAG